MTIDPQYFEPSSKSNPPIEEIRFAYEFETWEAVELALKTPHDFKALMCTGAGGMLTRENGTKIMSLMVVSWNAHNREGRKIKLIDILDRLGYDEVYDIDYRQGIAWVGWLFCRKTEKQKG